MQRADRSPEPPTRENADARLDAHIRAAWDAMETTPEESSGEFWTRKRAIEKKAHEEWWEQEVAEGRGPPPPPRLSPCWGDLIANLYFLAVYLLIGFVLLPLAIFIVPAIVWWAAVENILSNIRENWRGYPS